VFFERDFVLHDASPAGRHHATCTGNKKAALEAA
jgi:hypothetical protein